MDNLFKTLKNEHGNRLITLLCIKVSCVHCVLIIFSLYGRLYVTKIEWYVAKTG